MKVGRGRKVLQKSLRSLCAFVRTAAEERSDQILRVTAATLTISAAFFRELLEASDTAPVARENLVAAVKGGCGS